ncbi:PAC2 family protein [Bifidobacterium pluvialisilvae]|uniref:PAC2 family protein n=1 Tax=Bifidobacterium pluvialisilvae TaxID=2834436 RepID=UPI001F21D613|nr:PAC2 family protein [Bifidobacterium pluvialisilvae]
MSESMSKRRFMIAAFGGWNDACQAATDVIRHLLNVYESREIGHICCDSYYDYQSSRPMMCTIQGRRRIVWPETTFYEIEIDEHTKLYVEMGPEPNFHWSDFCQRSLRFADECEVTDIITLGSMFAECAHTRALPVSHSDGDDDDAGEDAYSGPVGIPTVLHYAAAEDGFEARSLWVSVPQYLGGDECPSATMRLLDEISSILDMSLEEGDLPTQAEKWRAKADMLMRCNDDLSDYVHHLERHMDEHSPGHDVSTPHARQLVEETEEFLRSFDHPAAE